VKKLSFLLSVLLVLMISVFGLVTVFAETQPATNPVVIDPVVTNPVEPEPSNPATSPDPVVTNPSEGEIPTEVTEPYTEQTEPETEFVRPTEYDEDAQPNTYSDYVSPAPIYTPSDQDFEKKDWEEIKIEIKDDKGTNKGNVGSFVDIKTNNNKGDEKSPLLLVLCIVFWCLALSCVTFVLVYKPKVSAVSTSKAEPAKPRTKRTEPKVSDDYNDGF